jgi:hypothetical protein
MTKCSRTRSMTLSTSSRATTRCTCNYIIVCLSLKLNQIFIAQTTKMPEIWALQFTTRSFATSIFTTNRLVLHPQRHPVRRLHKPLQSVVARPDTSTGGTILYTANHRLSGQSRLSAYSYRTLHHASFSISALLSAFIFNRFLWVRVVGAISALFPFHDMLKTTLIGCQDSSTWILGLGSHISKPTR